MELQWKDLKGLGNALPKLTMPFLENMLTSCLKRKSDGKQFFYELEERMNTLYGGDRNLPLSFSIFLENIEINRGDKLEIYPSVQEDFIRIINHYNTILCLPIIDYKNLFIKYLDLSQEEIMTDIKEKFKYQKRIINERINTWDDHRFLAMEQKKNKAFVTEVTKEDYIEIRKEIIWYLKHLEEIFTQYNQPLSDKVCANLDGTKMLIFLATLAVCNIKDNENENNVATYFDSSQLDYIHNALLIITFLEQQNQKKYMVKMLELGDILDKETIEDELESALQSYPDLRNYQYTYQDVFSLLRDKCPEFFKTIQKSMFRDQLRANWDFLPEQSMEARKTRIRSKKNEHSLQELERIAQRKEELLEEKLDFFATQDYLYCLKGTNHFEGYMAYIFENGKVVFEKFYRTLKQRLEPAYGEAIYVTDIDQFIEMSKCSKDEILASMQTSKQSSIMRICHVANWQQRLQKVIEGTNYTDAILNYITNLIQDQVLMIEEGESKNDSVYANQFTYSRYTATH